MINNLQKETTYKYFSDGLLRESSCIDVNIIDIIHKNSIDIDIKNKWDKDLEEFKWIYKPNNDYFIKAVLKIRDDHSPIIYFSETIDDCLYSFGLWKGYLDFDGQLYKKMLNYKNERNYKKR